MSAFDALALVEHVDRELDLICLIKAHLRERHGIKIKVANFYADAPLSLAAPPPRVVMIPFCYGADDVVLRNYVAAWPGSTFVNLAWEQLFYPSHEVVKAPRDEFSRQKVVHLAWSEVFVRYMVDRGVDPGQMRFTGHGLYQLYQEPYQKYFASRADMAHRYGLDASKSWVFVPENYRWAFLTDGKLRRLAGYGLDEAELFGIRDYCRRSMVALLRWSDAIARQGAHEVIFRPRPATSRQEILQLANRELGALSSNLRIMKEGSAREWVMSADLVVSSYSTVLIEAAMAGKPILKAEPEPVPAGLRYSWCELVQGAADEAEFIDACCSPESLCDSRRLRDWAMKMFFPVNDPVLAVTDVIAAEIRRAQQTPQFNRSGAAGMTAPVWLRLLAPLLSPGRRHTMLERHVNDYFFNRETHEKDLFGAQEVEERVRRWRTILSR